MISAMLLIAYSTFLIIAAAHDVATRTIPNWLPTVLLFVSIGISQTSGSFLAGMGFGSVVFGCMSLLWLRQWVGGGDVKLAASAAVAIPISSAANFILAIAIAGGLVGLIYLGLSLVVRRPVPGRRQSFLRRLGKAEAWRISRRGPIPYAAAIAAGGIKILIPTLPFIF